MLDLVVASHGPAPTDPAREVSVWRDEHGTPFARAFVRGSVQWIEWPGLGVFAFTEGSSTVDVWPDESRDPTVVADAFARVLQPIILQALSHQSLHASGVLGVDGVLAFCGVGRSGKSTLAYALGEAGFLQIADDALVLERAGSVVRARFLPFAPGLREPSRQHFDERQVLRRATSADVPPPASAPVRAVFLLQQDDHALSPESPLRIPPVQAFAALVTHARCFDEGNPAHVRRLVDDYLAVAQTVPVFALRYPARFGQLNLLLDTVKRVASDLGVEPFRSQPRLAVLP